MTEKLVDHKALQDCGVSVVVNNRVAHMSVGTGRKHNALGRAGWSSIERTSRSLATREDISVVVIQGVGASFCSGSDITEWQGATPDEVDETFMAIEGALDAIEAIPIPTVAAIDGVATGAGCELALSCDLRILSRSARMGMPILRLGILPSPDFARRLAMVIGTSAARELFFTGRLVDVGEAERIGLASAVFDDAEFDTGLRGYLRRIVDQPRAGLVVTKQVTGLELTRQRALHRVQNWRYSDPRVFADGVSAFLQHG